MTPSHKKSRSSSDLPAAEKASGKPTTKASGKSAAKSPAKLAGKTKAKPATKGKPKSRNAVGALPAVPVELNEHGDTQVGELSEALSYALKHAAAMMRSALAVELRPLDLTVAQHSCLELLGRSPGLSSAELARGAFVSRQSMNLVLRGLQTRGLVTRPEKAPEGRALPTKLTAVGRKSLNAANAVARSVEKRMISAIPEKRRAKFRRDLLACTNALSVD